MMKWCVPALCLAGMLGTNGAAKAQSDAGPETLRVPAYTAYIEPDCQAMPVSKETGITDWKDPGERVVWYGEIKTPGLLKLQLELHQSEGENCQFRLKAADQTRNALVIGANQSTVNVTLGEITIHKPGYYRFELEGVRKSGATFGDPQTLVLSGPAAKSAHFNLKERRNAASVHLLYPTPPDAKIAWFYNEVTVKTDPIWSYYMACGFRRGYFGIQVNSPTERRIIFSVWDSGNEGVDRNKVRAEDRVQLLAKGEGVYAGEFGNEGTGGHSHLVYNWKTGETYCFLVSAEPQGESTIYSGYFYFPEKQSWGLIARFRAPRDGGYLKGLYSFNEDFVGDNGQKQRLAQFGNQWIKTADGQWTELLTAKFSHDPTGKQDRLDYAAGVKDRRFYLSNGGFVAEPIRYGDEIHRPAIGKAPTDIVLPQK